MSSNSTDVVLAERKSVDTAISSIKDVAIAALTNPIVGIVLAYSLTEALTGIRVNKIDDFGNSYPQPLINRGQANVIEGIIVSVEALKAIGDSMSGAAGLLKGLAPLLVG